MAYVMYHFVSSRKQPYVVVADTTHRDTSEGLDELNRRVQSSDYKHIVVTREHRNSAGSKGIIILDFTNHKISGPYPGESDAKEIVWIGHKDGIGHLPSADWEHLAQEIASEILEYCDRGLRFDLYVNCPLALTFLIGAIVGPVKGLTLCEHNIYLQKTLRCFDLADPLIQGLSSPLAPGRADARASRAGSSD